MAAAAAAARGREERVVGAVRRRRRAAVEEQAPRRLQPPLPANPASRSGCNARTGVGRGEGAARGRWSLVGGARRERTGRRRTAATRPREGACRCGTADAADAAERERIVRERQRLSPRVPQSPWRRSLRDRSLRRVAMSESGQVRRPLRPPCASAVVAAVAGVVDVLSEGTLVVAAAGATGGLLPWLLRVAARNVAARAAVAMSTDPTEAAARAAAPRAAAAKAAAAKAAGAAAEGQQGGGRAAAAPPSAAPLSRWEQMGRSAPPGLQRTEAGARPSLEGSRPTWAHRGRARAARRGSAQDQEGAEHAGGARQGSGGSEEAADGQGGRALDLSVGAARPAVRSSRQRAL